MTVDQLNLYAGLVFHATMFTLVVMLAVAVIIFAFRTLKYFCWS